MKTASPSPIASASLGAGWRGGKETDSGDASFIEIAGRILTMRQENPDPSSPVGVVWLPSERELSQRLAVTRYVVRNALEYLEDNGDVQRIAGKAAIVSSQPQRADRPEAPASSTRCINFIQGPSLQHPTQQGVVCNYLAGYTEVLDGYDAKTRFLFWEDQRRDYDQMLWDRVPRNQQACVLVNRSEPGLLRWLEHHEVPYVVQYYRLYDTRPLPPHHKVYVNKTGGAYKAATHLMELGHQRIAFAGVIPDPTDPAAPPSPQFEGFNAAMRCAGRLPDSADLLPLDIERPELTAAACRAFLDRPDRPTAVITSDALVMQDMLRSAEALGIRVPDDMSVLSFANGDHALPEGNTFIDLHQRQLAHASVELLMEVMENPGENHQTRIIECDLRLGRTTAPPPHPS